MSNRSLKKILVVYYSQSGQLGELVKNVCAPLEGRTDITLTYLAIEPEQDYPFPWPFLRFFNTFPETVYADTPRLKALALVDHSRFDLVILAYQVWFLSPSLPVSAFLKTTEAKTLLADTPVITLIGCRNMWLMAQEQMKQQLQQLGAHLIDNVVLTDAAHSAFTFISTPLWMLTGKRGPFLKGLVPAAGISAAELHASRRFGEAIARQLPSRPAGDNSPMLQGLGAVTVNENLISSEKIARRSFMIWGRLLRAIGKPASRPRQMVLLLYIAFLVTMILTIVPLSALLKKLLVPFTRKHIAAQKRYYAAPSGSELH
jgi:hypothetical protein